MLFIIMRCQSTLCLKKFEFRILSASVVFVHLYLILQLIIYICKFTIRTEFNQFRAGLSDTAEHIDQFQLACSCICTINFNLIDSIINRTLGHGNESVLRFIEIFPQMISNRTVIEAISRHMGYTDLTDMEKINYNNFIQNPLVVIIQLADQTSAQWFNI